MRITLPSGTPAEKVVPPGEPAFGLVIVPDLWGLRPLFDDLAVRLADEWSAVVVAVEPFPGLDLPMEAEPRVDALRANGDAPLLRDVAAAADETGCDRVGLIGFCMGGMYALKAAGLGRFDRIVSFYGMIRVPEAWRSAGQGEPLDALGGPAATPVLAIVGGVDPYTPPGDVAALAALPTVTIAAYPEADHGFVHDPARPTHRPGDAADAWARAQAFLIEP